MSIASVAYWAGVGTSVAVLAHWVGLLARAWRSRRRARGRDRDEREALERRLVAAIAVHRERIGVERLAWKGFRPFRIVRKTAECEGVASFHLEPAGGGELPPFRPGQHVSLGVRPRGSDQPVVRCYSLSSAPDPRRYRITVRRIGRRGLVSNHLVGELHPGDEVELSMPAGSFHLPAVLRRPVLLIGGGIGLTPLVSMAHALAGIPDRPPVRIFLGFACRRDHPLAGEFEALAAHGLDLVPIVAYSRPEAGDRPARDYQHRGRLTVDLVLTDPVAWEADFYLCGPVAMLDSFRRELTARGIPPERIHAEAFGPPPRPCAAARPEVTFRKAGVRSTWSSECANLLELAEAKGLPVASGCRSGACGRCAVRLVSGEVDHLREPSVPVPDGLCLPCIAVPRGPVCLEV